MLTVRECVLLFRVYNAVRDDMPTIAKQAAGELTVLLLAEKTAAPRAA